MTRAYCVICGRWEWVGTYLYRCADCLSAWYEPTPAAAARNPERSP